MHDHRRPATCSTQRVAKCLPPQFRWRRPAMIAVPGKARGGRIPGVFNRRATQPGAARAPEYVVEIAEGGTKLLRRALVLACALAFTRCGGSASCGGNPLPG